MKKIFISLGIITASFFVLSPPSSVIAQSQDYYLTVKPPVSQIVIKPGTTFSHSVTLTNNGQLPLQIKILPHDFVADDVSGTPRVLDQFTFPYLKLQNSDLKIDQPFVLRSGNTQQLVLEFSVPQNAEDKEYHFVLLFEGMPQESEDIQNSHSQIAGQIGSTFIVTISDVENPQGNLQFDQIKQPILIDTFSSLSPQLFLKNTGKTVTQAFGSMKVIDMFGKEKAFLEFFPTNILPRSSREILAKKSTEKENEFIAESFRYKSPFLLGKYTFRIEFAGNRQPQQTVEYAVYAFPFSIVVFIGLAGIAIVLYRKTNPQTTKDSS